MFLGSEREDCMDEHVPYSLGKKLYTKADWDTGPGTMDERNVRGVCYNVWVLNNVGDYFMSCACSVRYAIYLIFLVVFQPGEFR